MEKEQNRQPREVPEDVMARFLVLVAERNGSNRERLDLFEDA